MRHILYILPLWLAVAGFADDGCENQQTVQEEAYDRYCEDEERGYFVLPCERARPYDRLLETEPSWAGKREDAFYDWLTE